MWTGFNLGFTRLEASNEGQRILATHSTVLSFTRDFFERKYKGKESIHTLHETFCFVCSFFVLPKKNPQNRSSLLLLIRWLTGSHTPAEIGSQTVSDLA